MQIIERKKREIHLGDYVRRRAKEDDCSELIRGEFKLIDGDTGEVLAIFCKPPEAGFFKEMFHACLKTRFSTTHRTGGLKTTSRVFGFNPRNAIRKDFCSATSLAQKQPEIHAKLVTGAGIVSKYYRKYNEELFDAHKQEAEKVIKDYKLADLPFTSGIVNDNNPLCYHFDAGNFRNVWSSMIVLRHKVEGGYLSLPEYDLLCETSGNSVFFFDGQNILHGVTPIRKLAADARRFSIVYYSLREMWNCEPLTAEIARARQRREAVEQRRLTGKKVKG